MIWTEFLIVFIISYSLSKWIFFYNFKLFKCKCNIVDEFSEFFNYTANKTLIIILVIRIYLLVSLIKKFICGICPCWVIRGCPEKHVVINDHICSSSVLLSSCDIESNWIQVLAQIALN